MEEVFIETTDFVLDIPDTGETLTIIVPRDKKVYFKHLLDEHFNKKRCSLDKLSKKAKAKVLGLKYKEPS